jgi:hypothetical protein
MKINKEKKTLTFVPYDYPKNFEIKTDHCCYDNLTFIDENENEETKKTKTKKSKTNKSEKKNKSKKNEKKKNKKKLKFIDWRKLEANDYEKYLQYCVKGFPDQDFEKIDELEHGAGHGMYEAFTRIARCRIISAMARGKSKIRKGISIGCIEPRYFDHFMRKANGKRSTFQYTKHEDLRKERVVLIKYHWNKNKDKQLPILGATDGWSKKKFEKEYVDDGVKEIRRMKVSKITLICNSLTWEVKMNLEWYSKRKLINGRVYGLSEEYQYCA